MDVIKEESYMGEADEIAFDAILFVEITEYDNIPENVGNVYYMFSWRIINNTDQYARDDGYGYAVYYAKTDTIGSVGVRDFYGNDYREYDSSVKAGTVGGVRGRIDSENGSIEIYK